MADTSYIRELIMMEKGKPTLLTPYLVSKDENRTLARAYLGTNQTINHNTLTKVNLDTESFDVGSNFANYKYVFPVTGYYHVDFAVYLYDADNKIELCYATVTKSGATVCQGSLLGFMAGGIIYRKSHGSDIVYGTAGEYLELNALGYTTDTGTVDILGTSAGNVVSNTFMSVYLIST